jgi:Zn-dependent protease
MNYQEQFFDLIYTLPAVLLAIILHECAHGLMSVWLGDDTPRRQGRLSLNPLHHIDPMGVLCLAVFKIGWAKPVQVDPRRYRNGKCGMVLVALAGPITNFLLAFLACLIYTLLWKHWFFLGTGRMVEAVYYILLNIISVNLGLGVFNLIPIPPLDGSKVLGAVLPERYYFGYMRYERYGTYVLIGLIMLENVLNIDLLPIGGLCNWLLDGMLKVSIRLFGL